MKIENIETMRPFFQRLRSRKFLMAVSGAILIFINEVLQQPVDMEAYKYISGIIVTWILGESYIDGKHK